MTEARLSFRPLGRMLLAYHYELLELLLAIGMFLWGAWLLMPWPAFESGVFSAMAALGPEAAWGVLMAGLGLIHGIAVVREDSAGRGFCSLVSSALWLFLVIQVLRGDRLVTPATMATFALGNAFCSVRTTIGRGLLLRRSDG